MWRTSPVETAPAVHVGAGQLEEPERVVAQTNVTDKRRGALAAWAEGLRAGPVVDVEHPRDDGEPHAKHDARATFHDCVGGVKPRPTARISRESECLRRGASAHLPSSLVGRAARAGANGRLRNEAGGAGAFRRDAAPTLALLLLWHVQTLVDLQTALHSMTFREMFQWFAAACRSGFISTPGRALSGG